MKILLTTTILTAVVISTGCGRSTGNQVHSANAVTATRTVAITPKLKKSQFQQSSSKTNWEWNLSYREQRIYLIKLA